MKKIIDFQIVEKQSFPRAALLKLKSDMPLPEIRGGQFVNVRVDGCDKAYLRRPISIHDVDYQNNTIDLLIDGEYVDELNDGMGLRGSSNQRLHFMSNRLLPFKEELEHGKRVIEFHIQQDKTVAYGIPKRKMFN